MGVISYPTETTDWSDLKNTGQGEVTVQVKSGPSTVFAPVTGRVVSIEQVPRGYFQKALDFALSDWSPDLEPPKGTRVVTIQEEGSNRTHKLWPLLPQVEGLPLIEKGKFAFAGAPIGFLSDDWRALSWRIFDGGSPVDPVSFLAEKDAVSPEAARRAQAVVPAPVQAKAQGTGGGVIIGLIASALIIGFATKWGRK